MFGSAWLHVDTVRAREEDLSCVSCLLSDGHPAPLPACPPLPTSLALDLAEGRGLGRRHHAETSGFGHLDSCTCILAKDARVGRVSTGSPFSDGLLPLAFLTLTLAPVWDGESAPPRPLPSTAAQPESLPGCSVAPPGQASWSTLPGFLYTIV